MFTLCFIILTFAFMIQIIVTCDQIVVFCSFFFFFLIVCRIKDGHDANYIGSERKQYVFFLREKETEGEREREMHSGKAEGMSFARGKFFQHVTAWLEKSSVHDRLSNAFKPRGNQTLTCATNTYAGPESQHIYIPGYISPKRAIPGAL